ncbi:MAG: hypothetical protein O3A51_04255 [Verrucomicrobia bacterium]|nr:hypothetical protein [Verrucomicrobiota bacterium]
MSERSKHSRRSFLIAVGLLAIGTFFAWSQRKRLKRVVASQDFERGAYLNVDGWWVAECEAP